MTTDDTHSYDFDYRGQDVKKPAASEVGDVKLRELTEYHKDPGRFWRQLKRLTGSASGPSNYLLNHNGNKRHTDAEKVDIHTRTWRQVYQEDDHYDHNTVRNFMNLNRHRITPHYTGDFTRLTVTCQLNALIALQKFRAELRNSKGSSPGKICINKHILTHLPDAAT